MVLKMVVNKKVQKRMWKKEVRGDFAKEAHL